MSHAPVIADNAAVFQLATGERVRVSMTETGLGVMGYALKVFTDRGLLLVQPSSGNAIDLYTPKSLEAEEAEKRRIVAARDGVPTNSEASSTTSQQGNWNPEPPCWLVEKREQGRTVGYLGHRLGSFEWMATPDLATRFVRREDANGVAECFEFEDVIVAEHIWG